MPTGRVSLVVVSLNLCNENHKHLVDYQNNCFQMSYENYHVASAFHSYSREGDTLKDVSSYFYLNSSSFETWESARIKCR